MAYKIAMATITAMAKITARTKQAPGQDNSHVCAIVPSAGRITYAGAANVRKI
jgi:hypothetical protein